jgi:translocation and assembly module TamB
VSRRRRRWKRLAAWVGLAVGALAVVFWIGVVALLNNNSFRQYLLRIAQAKLAEATGVQLEVRDFSIHLSGWTPALDLYDVAIDGAPPYETPALLKVDHIRVGIRIVALLERKWNLKYVVIDHPVAHLFVAENGDTNLPKAKGWGKRNVFDLGIRHLRIGRGEIYYNDQNTALDAELRDFQLQSRFEPGSKRYCGGLSYTDGRIRFRKLNPLVHSLQAEFEATADTFRLNRSLLTSGASELSLSATLHDYAHPKIVATYQASLDTGELRKVLKERTLPIGLLKLAGSAKFQSDAEKPVVETLSLDGNLSSTGLQIHTKTIHTVLREISARYSVSGGNAELRDLRAALLGGRMNGSFKMRDIIGAQASELHATLHNVALESIQALVNAQAMKDFRLTGTANASVNANWRKAFHSLTARTDATAAGTLYKGQSGQPPQAIPISADIRADYSAAAETVSFARSQIRSGQTSVNLDGTISRTASLSVQFQSKDLSEVETLANMFGIMSQPLNLGGAATFTGTVSGSTTDPHITGQLSAASLKIKGTEWLRLHTGIDASPSHIALRSGSLTPANNRGRFAFNINLGLDRWEFRETSLFQLDVHASQLNVADLKNLTGVQAPITGTLAATVSLQGTRLNPAGRGTVTLTEGTLADEPVQSASVDFHGTGSEVRSRFRLRMAAGTAQGHFSYVPKQRAYEGELQATGIRIDQIRNLRARNLNLAGTLNINAKGTGTFDDPGLEFTAQVPQLQIQNQTISGVTLQAKVEDHVATVAVDSLSQTLNTFVRGRGRIKLTGDYEAEAVFDTSAISLQPLLALYAPTRSADFTGQTEIHGTLSGPLKDKTRLAANITIPALSLSYRNNVQVAAVQPIQLDYSRGILTIHKTAIRGTGTDLQLQGIIPVASNAPMSIVALGTIDLGVGHMFDPGITSSGQIQFNIDGTGRGRNPNVQGQIKIVNAALAGDGLPIGMQNGNGVLTLTNNRLEIEKFEGKVSGGTLTAKGGLTYRPSIGFNLVVAADGIRTLFPAGVREGIDTNLTLVGSPQYAVLRGQVRLTELSFSPDFDLSEVISAVGGTISTMAPPGSFARNLNLDVSVISTDDLYLSSSKLSLQGAANLRIRGTAAEPGIAGRVNITDGDMIFRGNRYFLEPSSVDFTDPYRIQPRLNLAARTDVQDYDIRILLRGTLDQIRTTYTSEPPLPPSDIINLLVFGKTAAAQPTDPAPGLIGAQSLIASSVSNQVTTRIEKLAGISQLSVDPTLGGNLRDPGARITIQQRVTANLFVTFATDAASTQRQVLQLEYQATPRVAISGVRDQNGGFAFDVRIGRSW